MRILYFDLETSPYIGWFWRPGFKVRIGYHNIIEDAKIICASWKWGNEDKVHNADWGEERCDKNVLTPLLDAMNKADLVIAHNGDRFDLPWVRTRALVHGFKAVPRWTTMDTFKSVKANLNFPTNRLGDIAKYLGLEAKIDIPPDVWENCFQGDQSRMNEMLDYCDQDVRVLQAIHEKIAGFVPHKIHAGVSDGGEKYSCPHCGSTRSGYEKQRETAAGTIKHQLRCKDASCRKYFTISNKSYIMYLKDKERKQ